MKLYEIKNYLLVKVRKSTWTSERFIYFENGYWVKNNGGYTVVTKDEAELETWEVYEGLPKNGRFWRWLVETDGSIFKTSDYLNEKGMTKSGQVYPIPFDKKKWTKFENDWVDVVDGKMVYSSLISDSMKKMEDRLNKTC